MLVLNKFRECVARYGDKPAVCSDATTLTYAQLDRRASALAEQLRARGLGPESIVPICLDRSAEFVVAALAVLKAGTAYLPLGSNVPAQRLQTILDECAATCVIAQAGANVPSGVAVIGIDDIGPVSVGEAFVEPDGAHLAYVVFTSGSTGVPKGVQIEHTAFAAMTGAWAEQFGFRDTDRVSFISSVSFDAAVIEIWPTLCSGATLYLPSDEVRMSAVRLRQWLRDEAISVCWLPTPLMEHLIVSWEPQERVDNLRLLLTAGDRLTVRPPPHLPCPLINCYGPSEATVVATVGHVDPQPAAGAPHIGTALPPCRVYLLDENRQPVANGEAGELYVAGPGVGRGYLNQPEQTARAFFADPFIDATHAPARMYATGDLCRRQADGQLEYLGRKDLQVKIRGQRVELGEIEAQLVRQEGIDQACVIAHAGADSRTALTAFVVTRTAQDMAAIRTRLAAMLPDFMLPRRIVTLAALPLTAHGKVDRAALAQQVPADDSDVDEVLAKDAAAPVYDVAACFRQALNATRIEGDVNFLDAGGDSMSAVVLLDLIYRHLSVRVPYGQFFDQPSVAALEAYVQAHAAGGRTVVHARPTADARLPLSSSQEAVWFMLQRAPDNRAYHAKSLMRLRGALDLPRLHASLNAIVARHEIFRTTFHADDNGPCQRVHAPFDAPLPLIDLQHLPLDEAEAEALSLLDGTINDRFDMAALPLVRWCVVRLRADYHVLLHVEHHFVHDGWSYNIFLQELRELYRHGHQAALPPRRQFADFVVTEVDWLNGDAAAHQLDYWLDALKDAPPLLKLPGAERSGRREAGPGRSRRLVLPRALWQRCERAASLHRVTPFIYTLAVLNVVLARYANQDDICIGSALANRNWQDSDGIIGMLVNTVVLRNRISMHSRFGEFVDQVRACCVAAYDHQELPFSRLVGALNPERSGDHNPVFQVMLGFHDSPAPEMDLPGLDVAILEAVGSGAAKVDLSLVVIPRLGQEGEGDPVHLVWEWNAGVLEPGLAEAVVESFLRVFEAALDGFDQPIAALPVLADHECERLHTLLAGPTGLMPTDTLHGRFAQVAAQVPEQVAVVEGGRRIRYRELVERSDSLAAQLAARLPVDALVGICMPTSIELIIAVLGVLKAGAAYVPLDPSYPSERLRYIIGNAHANCVLTVQDLLDKLPPDAASYLTLNTADGSAPDAVFVPATRTASDKAYVIHTSGTTGHPKGVALAHGGVLNLLQDIDTRAPLPRGVAHSLWTNSCFDVSVYEIFSALLAHGSLHLVPESLRAEPQQLFQWLADCTIASAYLPPFFVEPLATWLEETGRNLSLKRLLVGVEPIREATLHGLQERLPQLQIVNGYGPSETTICCTLYSVPRSGGPGDGHAPIGQAVRNTRLYVLDEAMNPCPAGTTGELYIGGAGVAAGYLNLDALSRECFVANPFGHAGAETLYRSGDFVRLLANGQLQFAGRIDQQVKVRGYRVEPGEIEAVLRANAAVADAVVVARAREDGNHYLAAYVVPRGDASPEALNDDLRRQLPAYLVPEAIVLLTHLPVTANGKIDRKALPEPYLAAARDAVVEPQTELERQLIALFAQALGRPVASTAASFFQMGGHSLLAVQVLSRMYQAFGVAIGVTEFFERPSAGALAQLIELKRSLLAQQDEDDADTEEEMVF